MSTKTTLNIKAIILYGILIGVIVLAVIYFLPASWLPNNPVKSFFAAIASSLHVNTGNIGDSVKNLVTQNWATIAGVGLTAIPLIYTTIKSYLNQQKAKKELEAANDLFALKQQEADAKIAGMQQQIDTYNSDDTAAMLQKALGEKNSSIERLETQMKSLAAQNEELSRQPARICEQLWVKSGGQTISEGGHEYRIIEKTTVEVK